MMGLIEMQGVWAGYGKCNVLQDVDLSVPEGKITTLIGSNGSGKSTLLKAVLGFIPFCGDIMVDGISVKKMTQTQRARKIAYLPQAKNVPDISAGRLVLHGRFPYLSYPRKYQKQDFGIAEDIMKQLDIWEFAEKQMSELSGGIRQKVYIAMALAQQAPVIMMDEPTTYLDIGQQLRFAKMIRQLSQDGKTVCLVLHDISLALKISDRIAVMQSGKIIECGTAEEVLQSNVIDRLYGVHINSVQTDTGIQYYYE